MSDEYERLKNRHAEQRVKLRQALESNEAYRLELQQLKANVAALREGRDEVLRVLEDIIRDGKAYIAPDQAALGKDLWERGAERTAKLAAFRAALESLK